MRFKYFSSSKNPNLDISFLATVLSLLLMFRLISMWILLNMQHIEQPLELLSQGIKHDVVFGLISWGIAICLNFLSSDVWKKIYFVVIGILLMFELSSSFYFFISFTPLDRTLYQFSFDELVDIVQLFGDFKWYYWFLLLPIPLLFIGYSILKKVKLLSYSILIMLALIIFIPSIIWNEKYRPLDFEKRFIKNKTLFFIADSYNYFFGNNRQKNIDLTNLKPGDHPLLHQLEYKNSLAPFFKLKQKAPNLVFLMIESLSSSFSGPQAEEISFTPFLDSLAHHSIYFKNFFSTTERTFGILPSSLASLPNGEKGFLLMNQNMPNHESILSILKQNDYKSSFFYGGDANYDNMNVFLENNGVETIIDYSGEYSASNHPWEKEGGKHGVGDKMLFKKATNYWQNQLAPPFVHCYLTISTHQPFEVENQEYYIQKAKQIINEQARKKSLNKERYLKSLKIFSTFVYVDDAIKSLISQYAKEASFSNTIFLIYGDHMLAPIPKKNSLKKYNVPLYIYSPLLKRSKTVGAINTHLDIPPSIFSLLKPKLSNYPKTVSWLGHSFDTSKKVNQNRQLSLMLNNRERVDFLANDLFRSGDQLFKIDTQLNTHLISNQKRLDSVRKIEDEMVYVQNWTLKNNKLVENRPPTKILSEQQLDTVPVFKNEEYTILFSQTLKEKQSALLAKIKLDFKQQPPISKPLKPAPILVMSIKNKEGKTILWENIKYPYPNDSNIYEIQTTKFIQSNSTLTLPKDAVFNVYFWRNKEADTNFKVKKSLIKLFAVTK